MRKLDCFQEKIRSLSEKLDCFKKIKWDHLQEKLKSSQERIRSKSREIRSLVQETIYIQNKMRLLSRENEIAWGNDIAFNEITFKREWDCLLRENEIVFKRKWGCFQEKITLLLRENKIASRENYVAF